MNALFTLLLTLCTMIDLGTPRPLADAVASLSAKTPIGSALRSPDWQRVPLALRESAFFSSAVESARFVQTMQDRLLGLVRLTRERLANGSEGPFLSRTNFIADMRALANELGLDTTRDAMDAGTVRDITSDARLGLIFDIQTQRAAEYAKWKMEQDPAVLDAYPAQELVRIEHREVPRNWIARWQEAGGTFYAGRPIALKGDGIWTRISAFGTPWPPFDFNSGMGLADIARAEAERLGVIAPAQRVAPQQADFTDSLAASVRGISDRLQTALRTIFGNQIDIIDGEARWLGADTRAEVAAAERERLMEGRAA